MRAAVLHAPHDLRVEERPDPVPGAGEVVVEVRFNGLCGTDATEFTKGPMMVPLAVRHPGSGHVGPTTLGHEFTGTVVEAAPDARAWLGRRVACGAGVSCGDCAWCRRGRTNLCARYYTLGLSTHGGLADRVAAPVTTLREIPDGCDDLDAALAQPLAVGLHGVRRAGVQPGDRVVVLGAGAIGSFILAGLTGHDGPVVAVDIDAGRLEIARLLGATETQLVQPDVTPEQLRDLLPPAEVVIESSGVPGAAARAFALAARGGTVLLVGLTKAAQSLTLADVVLREIDVRTTVAHVCDVDLPAALQLLTERPLAKVMVDRVVGLEAVVADGFEPLAAGTVHGKVLVEPRHG
jgi:(R,R)-butanediol dehydrogenase / meso-butanediol dehydrogenase / diacetyl reductase